MNNRLDRKNGIDDIWRNVVCETRIHIEYCGCISYICALQRTIPNGLCIFTMVVTKWREPECIRTECACINVCVCDYWHIAFISPFEWILFRFWPFGYNALTFGFERKMLIGMRANQNKNKRKTNSQIEREKERANNYGPIFIIAMANSTVVCIVVWLFVGFAPLPFAVLALHIAQIPRHALSKTSTII